MKISEASSLPHWRMVLLVSKTASWDVSAVLAHEIHGRLLNVASTSDIWSHIEVAKESMYF